MRWVRPLQVIVVMAAVSLIGNVPAAHSQTPDGNCDYFSETGHYACDEFLEFFNTRGRLEVFGYPLTEAFDDPARGLRVQYFQRARMEWHPYNPETYKVQLGLLVDELGYQFPPASPEQIPPFNNGLRRHFPETAHVVSHAFLYYFEEHGGVDIFGYPRSEFMYDDGYIVQYFQRARMEWHPEDISGPQMRLTNLGEIYVERFGVPRGYDRPLNPPERIETSSLTVALDRITELRIDASVRYAITGQEGKQTVFVYVTDQQRQAVPGASVAVTVRYQSGDARYECEPTNENGFTGSTFDLQPALPGKNVVIDVVATYADLVGKTQTFFLPWW